MDTLAIIIFIVAILLILFSLPFIKSKRNNKALPPLPENYRLILEKEVEFYRHLSEQQQNAFGNRMQQFLSQVRITGVNAKVEDIDRVLIAASAIIPIFGFPDWQYINLNEVLLYPNSFNHEFEQK